MVYKKISLFLFAVLSIVLVFTIPFYNHWLNSKFGGEAARICDETQHLTPEERMEARFGSTYTLHKAIKEMLAKVNAQNVVVLLPPKNYIRSMDIQNGPFEVPEPAVFYYFTGYKAVSPFSADAVNANWALGVENNKMALRKIKSRQSLAGLLTLYSRYR